MVATVKPNLVVFLPDQQRADTLACYGAPHVHAPNLNRLAAESVIFERAYVTQPVCTPSRASLMTGLWPHQHGLVRNGLSLAPEVKCLPEMMRDRTYTAAYFGKWHLGRNSEPQHGFTEWISTERESDYRNWLVGKGVQPDKPDGTFSRMFVTKLPLELSKTRFLEHHACDFVRRERDRPFLLYVSFVEPHSPYNGPLNEEHDASEILLGETVPGVTAAAAPRRYELLRRWQRSEAKKSEEARKYFFGLTPDDYRGIRQRYYGLVSQVDHSIGAILRCLAENGLAENTIVVHTSDHGDMLGDHQLVGKEVMYEPATRVPWLIHLPGQRSSMAIPRPVSHIDFVPTLLELLGQPSHKQCQGKSLVPLIRGEPRPDDSAFVEWHPNRAKLTKSWAWRSNRAMQESTRTIISSDSWKMSLRDRDRNELYNLHADPREQCNLYGKKEAAILSRLKAELLAWQEAARDVFRWRE